MMKTTQKRRYKIKIMENINTNSSAIESVNNETPSVQNTKSETSQNLPENSVRTLDPLFSFIGTGSCIYAFFYTLLLYKNHSGITYPFFVGGTCLFFFFYLKKSGITAKKFSRFIITSLILLGINTCTTDSGVLIFFNKFGIFLLFFYMILHNLYEDRDWDIPKYAGAITNIICTSFVFIFRPFTDLSLFLKIRREKENKPEGKGKYVFVGVLISFPLLFVILILLYEADAVFSDICDRLFTLDFNFTFLFGVSFLFLAVFFASYSILCRISLHNLKENVTEKKNLEPVMGITFTGILSIVYLIFCYIQVVYLFGGFGTLPENYTYASYAREGFFQLVFVCIINLLLVLTCIRHFQENKILKGILTFISVCTYIMIASSTYRMLLYIQVYRLTFLRVFVLWALSVIFLLVSGALIVIYREKFPFTRYCLITVTILYLVFSFSHPDYWIARYNLSNPVSESDTGTENSFRSNFNYLENLSSDAAPVIFGKADELGYSSTWWFRNYAARIVKSSYDYDKDQLVKICFEGGNCLPAKKSFRKWNLSRWIGEKYFTEYYKSNSDFAWNIESDIFDYTGYGY